MKMVGFDQDPKGEDRGIYDEFDVQPWIHRLRCQTQLLVAKTHGASDVRTGLL